MELQSKFSKKNDISELLQDVADKLALEDVKNINEFIENNELGLAYETLCTQIYEYDIEISSKFYEKVVTFGISINCSSAIWTPLEALITHWETQ
jgi:hypothetical protein